MTPILLLHGALGAESQLEPLKALLQSTGRQVYTLNFSGHSRKPFGADFGIEQFTDDTLLFLDSHNLERVAIFGYSMGGYVAVWLALNNPERVESIVTLGTKYDWDPESAQKECRKMNAEKIEEKVPAFARILQARHSPELWKELLHNTASMMMQLGDSPLLNDENLSAIQIPVTVALGDQDDMADRKYSARVASILPRGKFVMLDNTQHPIEKVQLEKIVQLVLSAENTD